MFSFTIRDTTPLHNYSRPITLRKIFNHPDFELSKDYFSIPWSLCLEQLIIVKRANDCIENKSRFLVAPTVFSRQRCNFWQICQTRPPALLHLVRSPLQDSKRTRTIKLFMFSMYRRAISRKTTPFYKFCSVYSHRDGDHDNCVC